MLEDIKDKNEKERFSLSYISQVFDDAKAFNSQGCYFKRTAKVGSKNNTKTIMDTFLPDNIHFDRCLGNNMWTDTFYRTKSRNDIDSKAVSVHNSNNRTVFCKAKFKTARGGNRGSGVKTLLKDISDQLSKVDQESQLINAFAIKQSYVIDRCLKHKKAIEIQKIMLQIISFAETELGHDPEIASFLANLYDKLGGDLSDDKLTEQHLSKKNLLTVLLWIVLLATLTHECFKPCINLYKRSIEISTLVPATKSFSHIHADKSFNHAPTTSALRTADSASVAPVNASKATPVHESVRLTEDYSYLISKYVDTHASYKINFKNADGSEIIFPITLDYDISDKKVFIQDYPDKEYKRPSYLDFGTDAYRNIMETYPSITNNPNIRVDDWFLDPKDPDNFILLTSRTHYFDSLLTNRSLDYQLDRHTTLRELLFCENNVSTLKKSKLSNHLGYNGFIISNDGYVPFVRRGNNLSIESGKWGNSIQASLKTRYALTELDENGQEISSPDFTTEGLLRSIIYEIRDEMAIDITSAENAHIVNIPHIIAAYRNLIEGGKPQLLFYSEVSLSKPDIHTNFMTGSFNEQQRKLMDGEVLYWIHLRDLIDPLKIRLHINGFDFCNEGYFANNSATITSFDMSPSAVATLAMFIYHIRRHKDQFFEYL